MTPFFQVKEFCLLNKIQPIYIPGRLTNLLQPADVGWFSTIKKAYRSRWNHWFTFDSHEYTRHDNMKTPGYVLCNKWVSEIWDDFSADLVRKSFEMCGVHNNHQGLQGLRLDNLHSALRTLLTSHNVINNSIEMDLELAEANINMSNHVVRDLFSEGSAEGDEELVAEDEQMELLDYDEDELRILQELENDLIQSPELSSQYEIRSNMRAELSLVLTSSSSDDMSQPRMVLHFLTFKPSYHLPKNRK